MHKFKFEPSLGHRKGVNNIEMSVRYLDRNLEIKLKEISNGGINNWHYN